MCREFSKPSYHIKIFILTIIIVTIVITLITIVIKNPLYWPDKREHSNNIQKNGEVFRNVLQICHSRRSLKQHVTRLNLYYLLNEGKKKSNISKVLTVVLTCQNKIVIWQLLTTVTMSLLVFK